MCNYKEKKKSIFNKQAAILSRIENHVINKANFWGYYLKNPKKPEDKTRYEVWHEIWEYIQELKQEYNIK